MELMAFRDSKTSQRHGLDFKFSDFEVGWEVTLEMVGKNVLIITDWHPVISTQWSYTSGTQRGFKQKTHTKKPRAIVAGLNSVRDGVTFTGRAFSGKLHFLTLAACLVNRSIQFKSIIYNRMPQRQLFMFAFIMCSPLFKFTPQKRASSQPRRIFSIQCDTLWKSSRRRHQNSGCRDF